MNSEAMQDDIAGAHRKDGKKMPGSGRGRGRNRGSLRKQEKDRVIFASGRRPDVNDGCLLCCVDDTDDLSGDISTGFISELIAARASEAGACISSGITRHQLLLDEGIPYTSHNSSMCFVAFMPHSAVNDLHQKAIELIEQKRAPDSDPGLCIAFIEAQARYQPEADTKQQIRSLVSFGEAAQRRICTKDEAYSLASGIPWLKLTEHGGTGQGIIGALAGIGLRLGGEDGRFRGRWDIPDVLETNASFMEASALCRRLAEKTNGEVSICDINGRMLDGDALVSLQGMSKPVLHRGALTLIAERDGQVWRLMGWQIDDPDMFKEATCSACSLFDLDNDTEECDALAEPSCRNCLHRRWIPQGFTCMLSHEAALH